MVKNRQPPKLSAFDQRFLAYAEKLSVVRQYVTGFDGDKWERLYQTRPRTEERIAERRRTLARVHAKYSRLKPFLVSNKKRIVPKSPAQLQALRAYMQMPNIKGLKAVPVDATSNKLRVSFSVKKVKMPPRRGQKKQRVVEQIRVRVKEGHYEQEFYPFPVKLRELIKQGGPENLADNIVVMLHAMMPGLPQGVYLFKHRSFLMLEPKGMRDIFAKRAAIFFQTDSGNKDFVVANLIGVIRSVGGEGYEMDVQAIRDARTRAQYDKARAKIRARESALRKYIRNKKKR